MMELSPSFSVRNSNRNISAGAGCAILYSSSMFKPPQSLSPSPSSSCFSSLSSSSSSSSSVRRRRVIKCCCYDDADSWSKNGEYSDTEPPLLTTSSAYHVLGLDPSAPASPAQLKAAFRTKVKQFHPDVMAGGNYSDAMIRRVIQAYERLSNLSKSDTIERECMDPFDEPECEAVDLFVNEVLCIGKGCPDSCVDRAPHAFRLCPQTGTARATSQGHGEDYQVQMAVGQCPRSCIQYVTPSQRIILEELLESILNMPYDTSAEAELLYSLIVKAKYENNRYQNPRKNSKVSRSQHVDWF